MEKYKKAAFFTAFVIALIGTYNAVVINSESHLSSSEVKFVKRLDESLGVVKPGRFIAASSPNWKKLERKYVEQITAPVAETEKMVESAPETEAPAIGEELDLRLVEVINPRKYQQGLTAEHFSGNLVTNNGVIEALNVSLPASEGLSVSFSEMTGNVFEYDLNGEVFSGMMYQVDQQSFMVTLTNGPLEGTRLRFSQKLIEEQQQENLNVLAENHNVEVGSFGEAQELRPETLLQNDGLQDEGTQAQTFNFSQNSAL